MAMSLLQQLLLAGSNSREIAAEAIEKQNRRITETARRFNSRAENGNKKNLPTGLKQALIERLPVGKDNAITQAQIKPLIADIHYAESGLSATLSTIAKNGEACRTSERPYRYYK